MLKIYEMLWLAIALVMAIMYVTGNLTLTVAVVFGFVIFGMVFMGMMGVLPASISHPEPAVMAGKNNAAEQRQRIHRGHTSAHA